MNEVREDVRYQSRLPWVFCTRRSLLPWLRCPPSDLKLSSCMLLTHSTLHFGICFKRCVSDLNLDAKVNILTFSLTTLIFFLLQTPPVCKSFFMVPSLLTAFPFLQSGKIRRHHMGRCVWAWRVMWSCRHALTLGGHGHLPSSFPLTCLEWISL